MSVETMNNTLCLLDWDGTVRPGYATADWLTFLNQHNIVDIAHAHAFTDSEIAFREGKMHYDIFVQDAAHIYARAISGVPRHEIVTMSHEFVSLDETRLFSFCKPLSSRLQLAEIGVIVISGAPVEPLLAYSERLPLTKYLA